MIQALFRQQLLLKPRSPCWGLPVLYTSISSSLRLTSLFSPGSILLTPPVGGGILLWVSGPSHFPSRHRYSPCHSPMCHSMEPTLSTNLHTKWCPGIHTVPCPLAPPQTCSFTYALSGFQLWCPSYSFTSLLLQTNPIKISTQKN